MAGLPELKPRRGTLPIMDIADGQADHVPAADRLPRSTMIGWGVGTICPVLVLSVVNTMQLRFITDFVGLSAGIASMLIVLSKLYDAFADPTMGWISDHTNSRWGRRRPYLMLGGLMLALSLLAMFVVPPFESDAGRIAYTAFALLFYATGYTVFNIPYMSMPAEMSSEPKERTELISYRVYAVGVAQIAAMFCGSALVQQLGGGASAYTKMAIILAPVVLISAVVTFVMTRGARATARTYLRMPLSVQIRSVIENRPYMILIAVKFLTLMMLSAQSIFPFFFGNILGANLLKLGLYFGVISVAVIVTQPFWIWLARRTSKKVAYSFALLISIPMWLSWLWADTGEPMALIYLRGALIGATVGGELLAGQAMLPDTIEMDYLRTGLRREGIFAGFYTMVEKLAGAVGIGLVGFMLSRAGYLESRGFKVVQPQSALDAIRYIVALLPAVLNLLAVLLLFWYDMPERKLIEMRAARRALCGARSSEETNPHEGLQ